MKDLPNKCNNTNNGSYIYRKIGFVYKRHIVTTKKQSCHNYTADKHIYVFSKKIKAEFHALNTPGDNQSLIRFQPQTSRKVHGYIQQKRKSEKSGNPVADKIYSNTAIHLLINNCFQTKRTGKH